MSESEVGEELRVPESEAHRRIKGAGKRGLERGTDLEQTASPDYKNRTLRRVIDNTYSV